jgi:hypothetical protein
MAIGLKCGGFAIAANVRFIFVFVRMSLTG